MLTDEETLLRNNATLNTRTYANANHLHRNKLKTQMDMVNNPPIIPCVYGKELDINTDLVGSCLSAISVKVQHKVNVVDANKFEHRNSFFNLHRPEITMLNFAPTTLYKIEQFFHEHATDHGSFCASFHTEYNPEEPTETNSMTCLHPPTNYVAEQNEFLIPRVEESESLESVFGGNIVIPMTDEDLEPTEICHRSRAQFCVMIRNLGSVNRQRTEDTSRRTTIREKSQIETPLAKMEGMPSLSRSEFVSQVDEASEKGTEEDELSLPSAISIAGDRLSEVLRVVTPFLSESHDSEPKSVTDALTMLDKSITGLVGAAPATTAKSKLNAPGSKISDSFK